MIFPETGVEFLVPESFYRQIPNDPSGVCTLTLTTYAGSKAIGTDTATIAVTADPALCSPVVTEFTAVDTNPLTLTITQDDHTFIRHCSAVKCQVQAQGQKGAEITSILINGKSGLEFTADTDVLELVVTDSRGNTARESLTLQMLDYVMLTCHPIARRTTNAGDEVLIQVEGKHYAAGFPGAANQLRLACQLPEGSRVEIPYEEDGDNYRGQLILKGFSYQNTYTLYVEASDDLTMLRVPVTVQYVAPLFDWGKNDFTFRVPVLALGGVSGVHMGSFTGSFLTLYPTQRPQIFFLAGAGVQGVLTAAETCTWQGTEGVIPQMEDDCIRVQLPAAGGFLLSNAAWRE